MIKAYQTNANKKLLQKIQNSTEGWIAGIIMVCQIIYDFGIIETENLLEKSWQKTKLFNYITSEVLKTVDKDIMQFLVKAAVLQDFTVEETEEILDVRNAAHLVSQCEKKGLFIQRIIKDNITFRFHSLFRDALLQLQHEYITSAEIKDLNLKAAAYYIKHKTYSRAIEHFIICGDVNSAVELITKESVTLITFEAIDQLRVWLNLLPEEVVEQNPNLLYIKSFSYHQGKDVQSISLLEKTLAKFKEKNDPVIQVYTLMTLIHCNMFTNNVDRVLDAISQALSILKSVDDPEIEYMTDVLLFIQSVYEEEFPRAMFLSRHLMQCKMDEDWMWVVQQHSSMLGYLTGALDYAESSINEGLQSNLAKKGNFFKALALTYYCTVLYLKNNMNALAASEEQLIAKGEKYEHNFMLGFGKRASAYRKYAMHDLESAVELLDASSQHFDQLGNEAMASLNRLCSLLWLSHQKNREELLPEAEKFIHNLSSIHSGFCLREISQSIFGAIARECREYKLAEEYLIASAAASEKKGARQVLCGSCLHLAKLYFDTEEREKAADYLNKAFALASGSRYSMFWDIHLPTLTEMSLRCIKSGIYMEYARELMERYFKHEAVLYIEKNIYMIDNASIRDFSGKILSRYSVNDNSDFSCTIGIRLFGRFSISVNGTHIPEDEWKTKKIKGILEYLVLHKGRAITRDRLIEIFWPDSDKKSASASLRVALYELKKVLAKYGIKNDRDIPFIHEKTGSLEIKPNKMLSVDTDEFQSLSDEYTRKRRKGIEKKQLLPILERINSIYSGDLLSEEIYMDWTFTDREAYKSIFLEAVTDLAALYIDVKESGPAEKLLLKVLSIDPYNEKVCLMLLKLYVSENQRSRAAKLYSDFEKRLMKDLNIRPDIRLSQTVNYPQL